ncbi:hypothetical protein Vadar_013808 [Vaccinium darrowii]|uniref:Uncharacterized protein n=1 Tax=Vaccinium darrowii TaxID=229202 RepID=A0ACB7YVA7_9ERIC|nr:hypothetical protein Vadar_013808 [Vaccinium darrowii]
MLETEPALKNSDLQEDVSDASNSVDCLPKTSQSDFEERDWTIVHRHVPDTVPSVLQSWPHQGNSFSNLKSQKSPSRGRNQIGRAASDTMVGAEPESSTSVLSLQDRKRELEKHVAKKVVELLLFSL